MVRLSTIGAVGRYIGALVLGAMFFVLVVVGGGVYRTDCVTRTGVHAKGWELGGTLPYVQGAHTDCENHSLMRYVLGKVGVMSDVEPTYNVALIREIGAGSEDLASLIPLVQSEGHFAGSLNEPRLEALSLPLLKGELNKLTVHDIALLAEANRRTAEHVSPALSAIKALDARLHADLIGPSGTRSHSAAHLIGAWNVYLKTFAALLTQEGLIVARESRPALEGFQTLLLAALGTQGSRSTKGFQEVRVRFLATAARATEEGKSTNKAASAELRAAEEQLEDAVKDNHEAQGIIEQVNARHPHGALVQQFKRP